jgi:hypothetical protein
MRPGRRDCFRSCFVLVRRNPARMRYGEDFPRDIRMRPKRRGPRMNSRVSVVIACNEHNGPMSYEPAFTRVVSANGCLLVSPKELELQQHLRLTNLSTRRTVEGVVVWKGVQRPDGWDMGVEIATQGLDFWGVEL